MWRKCIKIVIKLTGIDIVRLAGQDPNLCTQPIVIYSLKWTNKGDAIVMNALNTCKIYILLLKCHPHAHATCENYVIHPFFKYLGKLIMHGCMKHQHGHRQQKLSDHQNPPIQISNANHITITYTNGTVSSTTVQNSMPSTAF